VLPGKRDWRALVSKETGERPILPVFGVRDKVGLRPRLHPVKGPKGVLRREESNIVLIFRALGGGIDEDQKDGS
jgi:hypothetical protein